MRIRTGITRWMMLALILMIVSGTAVAEYIVDTGAGPADRRGGWILQYWQALGGEFTIDQTYSINSVQTWLDATRFGAGTDATVAIYSVDSMLPDRQLYAAPFVAEKLDGPNWEGGTNLNWLLSPGTYFAVFKVEEGQSMEGALGWPVPRPLERYAFGIRSTLDISLTDWMEINLDPDFGDSFALRIGATAVPLPAPMLLLASGLIAIAGARRKLTSLNISLGSGALKRAII